MRHACSFVFAMNSPVTLFNFKDKRIKDTATINARRWLSEEIHAIVMNQAH